MIIGFLRIMFSTEFLIKEPPVMRNEVKIEERISFPLYVDIRIGMSLSKARMSYTHL